MANIGNKSLKNVYQSLLQISSSGEIADVTGSGLGLFASSADGGLTIEGNISASGTITAHAYHVQQITSSVLQRSGSTQMGDSSDDTHTFTGHITASGNISASGTDIIGNRLKTDYLASNGSTSWTHSGTTYIPYNWKLQTITYADSLNFNIAELYSTFDANKFSGNITASGNISASGTIYASKFESAGTSGETISFNDNLNITGHITASGNISGSLTSTGSVGHLYVDGKTYLGTQQNGQYRAGGDVYIGDELFIGLGSTNVGNGIYIMNGSNGQGVWFDEDRDWGMFKTATGIDWRVGSGVVEFSIDTAGNVTASGDISASGTIYSDVISFRSSGSLSTENASGYTSGSFISGSSDGVIDISGPALNTVRISQTHKGLNSPSPMLYLGNNRQGNTNEGQIGFTTGTMHVRNYNNTADSDVNASFYTATVTTDTSYDTGNGRGTQARPAYSLGKGNNAATGYGGMYGVGNNPVSVNFSTDATRRMVIHTRTDFDGGIETSGSLSVGTLGAQTGHITASGNISSSGIIYGDKIYLNEKEAVDSTGAGNYTLALANATAWNKVSVGASSDTDLGMVVYGHITASGNISGSITSTGSFGHGYIPNNLQVGLKNGAAGTELTIGGKTSVTQNWKVSTAHDKSIAGLIFEEQGSNDFIFMTDNGQIGINTLPKSTEKLTVAGNISSSGAIHTLSHITASGNISASGTITANQYGGNISGSSTSDFSGQDFDVRKIRNRDYTANGITFPSDQTTLIGATTTELGFHVKQNSSRPKLILDGAAAGYVMNSDQILLQLGGNNGENNFNPIHASSVRKQIGIYIPLKIHSSGSAQPNHEISIFKSEVFMSGSVMDPGPKRFIDFRNGVDVVTEINMSGSINTVGHITASGNISASGALKGSSIVIDARDSGDVSSITTVNSGFNITANGASTWQTTAGALTMEGETGLNLNEGGSTILEIADDRKVKIYNTSPSLFVDTHITASGNLSGSVTSTGSFGHVYIRNRTGGNTGKLGINEQPGAYWLNILGGGNSGGETAYARFAYDGNNYSEILGNGINSVGNSLKLRNQGNVIITISGSAGSAYTNIDSHITASGVISASSGEIRTDYLKNGNGYNNIYLGSGYHDDFVLTKHNGTEIQFSDGIKLGKDGDNNARVTTAGVYNLSLNTRDGSYPISGSGYGGYAASSQVVIETGTNANIQLQPHGLGEVIVSGSGLHISGAEYSAGHITASGNISASGNLSVKSGSFSRIDFTGADNLIVFSGSAKQTGSIGHLIASNNSIQLGESAEDPEFFNKEMVTNIRRGRRAKALTIPTWPDGAGAKAIDSGSVWKTTTDTSGTNTLREFTGGIAGDIITVICSNANTAFVQHLAGNLKLNGTLTCGTNDVIQWVYDGTSWFLLSVSDNSA